MLIDSHCHLSFDDYAQDFDSVYARAMATGVQGFVNICTKYAEADELIRLSEQHDNIYASIGIHPHEAEATLKNYSLSQIHAWLMRYAAHPKVVLIGETGLDYHYEHSPKDLQQQVFKTHIAISQKLDIPLSIHTRSADADTIVILQEMAQHHPVRGILHCFTGTPQLAEAALELGMYISISGIVTFNKSVDLQEIVKTIPLDRLLVETDAPYLAPTPYRGKRNEPAYIIETVKKIAALKEISVEEIMAQTTENFKRLCNKFK